MNTKSVKEIFLEVPRTYELVNHILTMGFDIAWRERLARLAAQESGRYWLDIASGTGDTAVLLRKLARPDTTIASQEFYRILKPGGKFLNLETSQPRNKMVKRLFHLYTRRAVMPIGSFMSGSKTAYRYLSSTIPVFFGAEELSDIIYAAGFKSVSFEYLTSGICAIHTAVK